MLLCSTVFAQKEIASDEPIVKITWSAAKVEPGKVMAPVSYIVLIGETPGKYSMEFPSNSPANITLTFGKVYYAAVKAIDSYGLFSISEEIIFKLRQLNKVVEVLTSKDGGKTWIKIGEAIVPKPIVTGQKYKTKIVNK